MGEQLNIRNAKVIARVRQQAALRGVSMTELIDMAVERLPSVEKPMLSEAQIAERLAELKALLDLDHSHLKPGFTTSMDEFYDQDTGAPI